MTAPPAPIDIECPFCRALPRNHCSPTLWEQLSNGSHIKTHYHHAERVDAAMRNTTPVEPSEQAPRTTKRDTVYYGLLRVHADGDGRLTPLWYTVGDASRFEQMTVVDGEYTIAICTLSARSMEEARTHLKEELRWFKPLLGNATPEPWFASEDPAR